MNNLATCCLFNSGIPLRSPSLRPPGCLVSASCPFWLRFLGPETSPSVCPALYVLHSPLLLLPHTRACASCISSCGCCCWGGICYYCCCCFCCWRVGRLCRGRLGISQNSIRPFRFIKYILILGYNTHSPGKFPLPICYTGCSGTPSRLCLYHFDTSVAKWQRVALTRSIAFRVFGSGYSWHSSCQKLTLQWVNLDTNFSTGYLCGTPGQVWAICSTMFNTKLDPISSTLGYGLLVHKGLMRQCQICAGDMFWVTNP